MLLHASIKIWDPEPARCCDAVMPCDERDTGILLRMSHAPGTADRGVSILLLPSGIQNPVVEAGPHTDDGMKACGPKVGT